MRKWTVLLLAALIVVFAGCTGQAVSGSTQQPQALKDAGELQAIAYEHAGVAQADVYDVQEQWQTLPDKTLYKLEFDANGVEYEYGLNGHTGAVVYSTYEGAQEDPGTEEISADEAQRIALEHAGFTQEDVTGLQVELDREDRHYEVEFHADGMEYDYEIDCSTGDVLRSEKEKDQMN